MTLNLDHVVFMHTFFWFSIFISTCPTIIITQFINFSSTPVYTRVSLKRDKIIRFLAADVSPGELADKLLVVGLIGENVRDKALVTSIPVYDTIRPMIDAVLSRIELNGEIYDKFIGVLRQFQSFDDLIQFIERPEQ